ncbi:MAG: alkaline phosphatase family protein [Phycisphaerae bacterium]|nr:alkaline phosphatase family protein [Phycisphaerae bacterium]
MTGASKVILVGWDGATFRILQPLIDAGVMPTLARMVEAGASGVLRSTHPPVTCPAWPTMFTGVGSGRHGVFSFAYRCPETGHVRTAAGSDVAAPKLWDLLGKAGKRVSVLNVPITFPAGPVNGVMMTGFVSPDDSPRVMWPADLRQVLVNRFGDLALNWAVLHHRPSGPKARRSHIRRINELMRLRNEEFELLLDLFNPDFCFLVFEYPDRVQHLFYHLLDPRCEASRRPENRAVRELLCEGFAALDEFLARLLRRFGDDANTMIVSDHGFDAVSRWVYVNNLLACHGLLAIHEAKAFGEAVARRSEMPGRLRAWLGLEQREPWHRQDPFRSPLIRYDRSRAFAGPQLEHAIYVNLEGRSPHGVVKPGHEYEAVRQAVIDVLTKATDPQSGRRVFENVWRREEILSGPCVRHAPDVIYELAPGYMASDSIWPASLMRDRFLRDLPAGWDVSGYHRPEGVLIGGGPAFRAVRDLDASIIDVAPTVLYLMNQSIPSYLEGRVLLEALQPSLLERRPLVAHESSAPPVTAGGAAYSIEEERQVASRLEDLGYL